MGRLLLAIALQYTLTLAAPPDQAPDLKDWAVTPYEHAFTLAKPGPGSGALSDFAFANGICALPTGRQAATEEKCEFTLRADALADQVPGPKRLALRYAIRNAAGTRVEGFALADLATHAFRYFRLKDGAWAELAKDSPEDAAEDTFVKATFNFIVGASG